MNTLWLKTLRDLWLFKARTLLVVLAIAVGTAAVGMSVTSLIVLRRDLREGYARTNPAHAILDTTPFDAALADEVAALPEVDEAEAWQQTAARVTIAGEERPLLLWRLPDNPPRVGRLSPQDNAPPSPPAGTLLLERSVRPVGALAPIPIDVRIVSATHRDLAKAIAEGAFREDLYYRLNVVSLALPSLSERREDIALLAAHFMRETALQNRRPIPHLAPDAMEMLVKASWPGNVRQLANVIEHAVTLATTPVISAALIAQALSEEVGEALSFDEARRRFEYDYLVQLLETTGGNVTRAARVAQRNRTEFYKLLARHGIDPASFK